MQQSLSRGHTSGITVVLSGRGFLQSCWNPGASFQEGGHIDQDEGAPDPGAPIPVKLQLLTHKRGGYTIRALHNDDRLRAQPIVEADISELSILHHTAQDFHFMLNRDGSQHVMSFSNLREGQQFQFILGEVKTQGLSTMSIKRGTPSMAARFPGMAEPSPSLEAGAVKKSGQRLQNDRTQHAEQSRGSEKDVYTMVDLLKLSIASGDVKNAEMWARNLANIQPKLSILVEASTATLSPASDISVQVQVEDRESSKIMLRMSLSPNITISGLKKMVFLRYGLPIKVQNWIIGGRIVKDKDTLSGSGITSSGATLYLYTTSAQKVNISKQDVEIERHAILEQQKSQRKNPQGTQNRRTTPGAEGATTIRRSPEDRVVLPAVNGVALPSSENTLVRLPQSTSDPLLTRRTASAPALPTVPLSRIGTLMSAADRPREKRLPSAQDVGWKCPMCTLVNPPLIPGCQACMQERPTGYTPPEKDSYVLDPAESLYLTRLDETEKALKEMDKRDQLQNYQDLLRANDLDLVANHEPFECPVCLTDLDEGEGVVLRECLHTFCKECLREHLRQSVDALVMCPGMSEDGDACTEHILEREIKALLNEDDFQRYLERGLRRAEATAANSFHCKTTDCRGFCFYEDDNNFFDCPICHHINCLTCKAIHEGIDCKEYQEDLRIRAQNDVAARKTQEALENLVKTGDALKCPKCSIVVQKKGGCDWIKCSVCQLEICWVTKQARWGPGGVNDISGGCRCRVNGKKCHPNCHNCH